MFARWWVVRKQLARERQRAWQECTCPECIPHALHTGMPYMHATHACHTYLSYMYIPHGHTKLPSGAAIVARAAVSFAVSIFLAAVSRPLSTYNSLHFKAPRVP